MYEGPIVPTVNVSEVPTFLYLPYDKAEIESNFGITLTEEQSEEVVQALTEYAQTFEGFELDDVIASSTEVALYLVSEAITQITSANTYYFKGLNVAVNQI